MDLARRVNRMEKDHFGQRTPCSWEQCPWAHKRSWQGVLSPGGQWKGSNERVPDLRAGNREQKAFILVMDIRKVFPPVK